MTMVTIHAMLDPFYEALFIAMYCEVSHPLAHLVTLITTTSWCYYYSYFMLGQLRHEEVNLSTVSLLMSGLESSFAQV